MAEVVVRGGVVLSCGAGGVTVTESDVVVEGGRIADIRRLTRRPPRRSASRSPAGASSTEEIDAAGCLVIPGLIQAHVHLCQTLFRGLADDMDVITWLRRRVWPLEQAHDYASLGASAALGVAELLRGGTTSVLTMESMSHTEAAFEAAERLGIRAIIGKALMDRWEPGTEMVGEDADDAWSEVLSLLERWHGAGDGRLGVALSPRGPRNASPETWRRCVELAREADLRLHTHVNENREQADRLGASPEGRDVEALASWGALDDRLVMAHCVWLSAAERSLLRRHRAHVCHCPSANLKLASGLAPVVEYLADGVNVALGADGAACNNRLDGFEEMRLAALLHKPSHGPRALPAALAFEMATLGGARALGLERDVGSIEVGKIADLVVVRRDRLHSAPVGFGDPVSEMVYTHRSDDVSHVLVGGRVVVADSRLLTADENLIRAEAEAQRAALLGRAGLPD